MTHFASLGVPLDAPFSCVGDWFGIVVYNGVGHVKLSYVCRSRVVLRLVTFCGSTMSEFIQATQPSYPAVGRCTEYWRWFRSLLRKKWRVLRSSGPRCHDCSHTDLLYVCLLNWV